jgi:hypothetical protein
VTRAEILEAWRAHLAEGRRRSPHTVRAYVATAARLLEVSCIEVEQNNCLLGDPAATRSIVLVGDSHAAHWIPALDPVAKDLHLRLSVRGRADCPIAVPVLNLLSGERDPACETFRMETLGLIDSIQPAAVIVASSTGYGGRILDESGHALHGRGRHHDRRFRLFPPGPRGEAAAG